MRTENAEWIGISRRQGEIPIARRLAPAAGFWHEAGFGSGTTAFYRKNGDRTNGLSEKGFAPRSLRKVKQGETEKNDECIGER